MRKLYLLVIIIFIEKVCIGQYPLTLTLYTQDFNNLGTTNSTVAGGDLGLINASLNGWYFYEMSGNTTISANDGTNNGGDSYKYGLTSERSFGGLGSGSVRPNIGFYFTNGTTSVITSLAISYTGEQWRSGATVFDKYDFQYSQNATALNNGDWVDADVLDFIAPINTGTATALNGNLAVNQSMIVGSITGLYIPAGATFFIRWADYDASLAEHGLAIDDFSITGFAAASSTDYFRTVSSGSWTNISIWESSPDNSTWSPATTIPNATANTILIRNGHTVNYSAFLPINQLTIENGATLNFITGYLIAEDDGSSDEINIQSGGVMEMSSNLIIFSGIAPTINIESNAILRIGVASFTTTPGGGIHANNYVYQHQSILEYTINAPFGTVGVTYFPNVVAGVIPIFRITQTIGANVGSGSITTINGILEANGNLTFVAAGIKTFRNGIRGTGNINGSTSGKFVINGLTAEIGGTGTLTTPAAGLEVGPSTLVNVTSNKTITGDITLLASSFIQLGANNLSVSGVISGGSSNSYVRTNSSGLLTLKSIGAVAKTFPIGNTSYNPIIIVNGSSADYSARVATGINDPSGSIPADAVQRTWYISASATTTGVTVTYQYANADCTPTALPQPMNMEILQSDGLVWHLSTGNGSIPSFAAGANWTVTSVASLTINNILTPYSVAVSGTQILAIDCIISCHAKKTGNNANISFNINTCAQVNNFEVQRSTAGGNYQTIATLAPDLQQTTFNYTDNNIPKGINLYRIKVNRSSNGIKYSNTVAIINDSKGLLITGVYPNPVEDKTTISVSSAKKSSIRCVLVNMQGIVVKEWTSNLQDGNNLMSLTLKDLSPGIYYMKVMGENVNNQCSIIKL